MTSDEFVEVPTLGDLLVRAATRWPDRPALTVGDDRFTFAQLRDRAESLARGLLGADVRPGDRVGLLMPNCSDFVAALFATAMTGAVVVPINSRFRSREIAHVVEHAGLKVVLTSGAAGEAVDHPARLFEVVAAIVDDRRPVVVLLDGERTGFLAGDAFVGLGAHLADALDTARAAVRLRDVAAVLYTSGTTSLPKGCVHTHEALVRNGIVTGRSRFLLTEDDRFWNPLPMFHVAFLTPLIACVAAGAQFISMPHFDGETALDLIESLGATWVFASFLAIARGLLEAPSFSRRDLRNVRMTMCVGSTPSLRRFQAAFPQAVLLSTYGSTETGGVITYHEPNATAEQRVTTCGTPFRGVQLAIKDLQSDDLLPTGALGEILVHGYSVLDGYLDDPAATRLALDAGRWLHTGDIGLVNADGHLEFRGRRGDLLKVGGENVGAAEVEALLAEHPAIAVAQVVGAPDDTLEEVVAAFIELVPGGRLTASDAIEFCVGKLASYKIPRHVRFVTDWPMSATKIRKGDLKRQLVRELAGCEGTR